MNEISLHILDILQNSIKAGADLIIISLEFNSDNKTLCVTIKDNGCGMDEKFLKKVCNPFVTTRTTRKVGLGIPLFKAGAEGCGGTFFITSKKGIGTIISATFNLAHIDCPPLGKMTDTFISQVICHPDINFEYKFKTQSGQMHFSTAEVKSILKNDIPLSDPNVITWMKESINEEINQIGGGAVL